MPPEINTYLQWLAISSLGLFAAYVFLMETSVRLKGTVFYHPFRLVFGVPFVIADVITNWIISPLFIDPPAHPFELVTARMQRYKKLHSYSRRKRFRRRVAVWLCEHLNRYDPDHC